VLPGLLLSLKQSHQELRKGPVVYEANDERTSIDFNFADDRELFNSNQLCELLRVINFCIPIL
jgi:hypothetical protein